MDLTGLLPGPVTHLGQARFEAAFDLAPVPMAIISSRSQRIVRVNRALAAAIGVDRDRMEGRALGDYRTTAEPVPTASAGASVGASTVGSVGASAGAYALRSYRRSDGTTAWFEVHSALLPGPEGSEPLCLLHLLDVTPRLTAERHRAQQQAVATALGEIRLAVLLGAPAERLYTVVCRRAQALFDADEAVVFTPAPSDLQRGGPDRGSTRRAGTPNGPPDTVLVAAGDGAVASTLVEQYFSAGETVAGEVLTTGRVVVSRAVGDPATGGWHPNALITGVLPPHGSGHVLALPLRTPDTLLGVLALHRAAPFDEATVSAVRGFVDEAAGALHLGELRADRERLRVLEDRERIARDLHDSVIQELFAAGMSLGSALPQVADERAARRVAGVLDRLDSTIRTVRSTIFDLNMTDDEHAPARTAPVEALQRAVTARTEQLGFTPTLVIDGSLDDVPRTIVEHVLAVVSEGLSNVARHAGASTVTVALAVGADALMLTIRDDGRGFETSKVQRGNGLANLRRRAELLGGRLDVASSLELGTLLTLTAPMPSQPSHRAGLGEA